MVVGAHAEGGWTLAIICCVWRMKFAWQGILEIAAKAGFDPRAAVTLWKKMADESGQKDSRFDFLSTHPAPVKRMEELEVLTQAMLPYYEDKSPRPAHPVSAGDI